MKAMLRHAAVAAAFLCILAGAIAHAAEQPAAVAQAPAIHIYSCQVVSGKGIVPESDEVGLIVRFQNNSQEELSAIVFRANYGKYPVDFIDNGTFTPSVQIDNYLVYERGKSHFNFWGAAGDLLAAAVGVSANEPLRVANMAFPNYAGTEDPENCSVVATTFKSGAAWINPALPRSVALFPAPTPPPKKSVAVASVHIPTVSDGPVELERCQLSLSGRGYLDVKFRNTSQTEADRVVFRAPFGKTALDFVDVGLYSNSGWVPHVLKLSLPEGLQKRQYLGFDDPAACNVVSVHFADGTEWKNSSLPTEPLPVPTPVPNAILQFRPHWQSAEPTAAPTPTAAPRPLT